MDGSSVIATFHLWWPKAHEDRCDAAADAWDRLAGALDDAGSAGLTAVAKVTSTNAGPAVDAFHAYWQSIGGSADAPLGSTATSCRMMATALRDFADKVREARRQVWEVAITIVATMAAGIGLAWCTFGISAGAAAAATTALCASVGILEGTIAAAVVGIAMAVLVGAAFGAIEAFAISFAVAQPIRMAFHPGTGFSLDEALDYAKGGAVLGGLFGGGAAGFRALRGATGPAIHGLRPGAIPGKPAPGALESLSLNSEARQALEEAGARSPWPRPREPFDGDVTFRSSEADRLAFRDSMPSYRTNWYDNAVDMINRSLERGDLPAELRGIPSEDLVALREYGGNSWEINNALRTGDPALLAQQGPAIRATASGLNQLPAYEGVVRRGVNLMGADLDRAVANYTVGQVIEEPAFVSTSTALQASYQSRDLQFIINSRTGRAIEGISFSGGEGEVLFGPGSTFRVLQKEFVDGQWFIYLDEVTGAP